MKKIDIILEKLEKMQEDIEDMSAKIHLQQAHIECLALLEKHILDCSDFKNFIIESRPNNDTFEMSHLSVSCSCKKPEATYVYMNVNNGEMKALQIYANQLTQRYLKKKMENKKTENEMIEQKQIQQNQIICMEI
ncbi:MAG TPA: hypothetical protein VMV95_01915 [Bacillota bacterium]|nr:hypothetical protein [Bacillota bacterium]